MSQPCGCCAGIEIVTPEAEANRPGLPAIAYRVGTYATFFETMLARLSSLYLDVPAPGGGASKRIYPLRQLTTGDPRDLSIALLDAWAMVADVLTFYQERVANEGYLRTSMERESVLELARLIGYKLRPGVSASVYLAFTVAKDFTGTIPAGTRAQSIPGTGETAQFFEASDVLAARDKWNNLKPRLTRPQVITAPSLLSVVPIPTAADKVDTLYIQGISTNLKTGDALLIVVGDGRDQQVLRFVESVDAQADQNRTEVTLQVQPPSPMPQDAPTVLSTVKSALQPFILAASTIYVGSDLAGQVGAILQDLLDTLSKIPAATGAVGSDMVRGTIPAVRRCYNIAIKRGFTRLAAGIQHLLDTLQALVTLLPGIDEWGTAETPLTGMDGPVEPSTTASLTREIVPVPRITTPLPARPEPSPLANLGVALEQLSQPPSLQPPNSTRLARSISQTFAPQADTAARLLAAFKPSAAPSLYQAWADVQTPTSQVQVYAMRVKASLFGHNALSKMKLDKSGTIIGGEDWPIVEPPPVVEPPIDEASIREPHSTAERIKHEVPNLIDLDSSYDKILPNSWIVVQTPQSNITGRQPQTLYAKAMNPTIFSRGDYGMSGKITQIELGSPADPLDSSKDLKWITVDLDTHTPSNTPPDDDFKAIRQTVVYAQPELLELTNEPLDTNVAGETVELDGLYDGLEPGRWIVVSGNRTDVPNVRGVKASELVMVAGIEQGAQAPFCANFPPGLVPFSSVYYTTDPNVFGDRLVVGVPTKDLLSAISADGRIPLPSVPNQAYCDQVRLAPGVFANAYVPTREERNGSFNDFQGLLVNPETKIPYPKGSIDGHLTQVFAWRISSAHAHTILTLANSLAYSYDSANLTIYGNVVKATHGQTVGEVLGNGDASQAFQAFAVHQSPLTYIPALTQGGAASTLVVTVNDIKWHEAGSLVTLGPNDRGYITQTDDAGRTSVIFGNGEDGARIPSGSANVKAVYRYGTGAAGNVGAGQISQLATHPLGVQAVINPLPATGGADADSRDQGRRNTPVAVTALDRLVSVQDYADFARNFAGIGKAAAASLSDGRRQVVHLTIAGAEDAPIDPSSDLYQNLVLALHQLGDPYQPILVCVRRVKLLVISAGVKVLADYQWESVEPNIRAELLKAFSFDARALGQSAFLSEVVSTMQGIEGVDYVNVTTFDFVAEDTGAAALAGLADTLGLKASVESKMAWVDASVDLSTVADPTVQDLCRRIRPAELVFLTPDIPGTLILTEITAASQGAALAVAPSPAAKTAGGGQRSRAAGPRRAFPRAMR
jgi:hypothetical protein